MSAGPRLLHADAVIVGDGSTVRDGAIVVDDRGVIRDVGDAASVRARSTGASIERLSGVLFPGLVNAHTHLELSGLRGKTTIGAGFVPWLTSLQRARLDEDELERDAAIDRAIAQLVECGVVAVGEVSNSLVAWRRLARHLVGVIFHEVYAMDRDAGLAQLATVDATRDEMSPTGAHAHALDYVLAPHALYSTHPDVVRAIVARSPAGAMTMHLAEHAAERAFLERGEGPWREFLTARGAGSALDRFPIPRKSPIEYAASLGVLRPGAAMVHLTDARPDELALVAEARAIAVLCPRSNLTLETRLPPLLAMRAAGVDLALGTDSLSSSPSLDPLAEARALHDRTPDFPASVLVAAATSGGARALGFGDRLGRLAVGLQPGVLHVATPASSSLPGDVDPSAWLLRAIDRPRRVVANAMKTGVSS